jgi:hypothetical protein
VWCVGDLRHSAERDDESNEPEDCGGSTIENQPTHRDREIRQQ